MRNVKKILAKHDIEYVEELIAIFEISGYKYCILHDKLNGKFALANYISEMKINRITEFMMYESFKFYLNNFLEIMIDKNLKK